MCLKRYTEAEGRRAGSRLVTGCTGNCHFDTVRCGQGGIGLSLWWPYGFRLPDLVYVLSSLFIMNIAEMIGISLRIVLRCFHDLMFFVMLRNKEFLIFSWFLIQIMACRLFGAKPLSELMPEYCPLDLKEHNPFFWILNASFDKM